MATIRNRGGKWQVQLRQQGRLPVSKTFTLSDAVAGGRKIEAQLDRGERPDMAPSSRSITLRELLERYRDTVVPPHLRPKYRRRWAAAFYRIPRSPPNSESRLRLSNTGYRSTHL